jgi:hypothetical protein
MKRSALARSEECNDDIMSGANEQRAKRGVAKRSEHMLEH